MSRTQAQYAAPTAQTIEESPEFQKLLQKNLTGVEFIPFGQERAIKLDFYQIQRLVSAKTKSGKVANDDDIWRFMKRCEALRANPYTSDIYLIGYDSNDGPKFAAVTSVHYMMKRAEINPHFAGIQAGVVVLQKNGQIVEREGDFIAEGERVVGGWAKVYRRDRDFPFYNAIKLSTYEKGTPNWRDMKEHMIVKCARADVLRQAFPSEVGSLFCAEEFQRELALQNEADRAPAAVKQEAKDRLRQIMEMPVGGVKTPPPQQQQEPPEPPSIEWDESAFSAELRAATTVEAVNAVEAKWEPVAGEEAGSVAGLCEDKRQALKGGA